MTGYHIGQIKAHMHHELGPTAISRLVAKPRGKGTWSPGAMAKVMKKITKDKEWDGERKTGSGAQKKTTKAFDRKVVNEVLKNRGKKKVTVAHIKKVIIEAREYGDDLILDRLGKAGLKRMHRRKKTLVPSGHEAARLEWAAVVKRKHQSSLDKWAYSDGMSYYLAKTASRTREQGAPRSGAVRIPYGRWHGRAVQGLCRPIQLRQGPG
jgi:hypothetical protein